jgi:hypothetical protein
MVTQKGNKKPIHPCGCRKDLFTGIGKSNGLTAKEYGKRFLWVVMLL